MTTFRLSTEADAIQLPDLVVPVMPTAWVCFVVLVLLDARRRRTSCGQAGARRCGSSIVYVLVFVFGFLTWAAAGATIPVVGPARGVARRSPSRSSTARSAASSASGRAWSTSRSRVSCSPAPSAPPSSRRSRASPSSACSPPMVAGVLVAFVLAAFAIKYLRRPGHRRRRPQRARHRPHELPLLAGAPAQRRAAERAAAVHRIPIPILSEIPVIGPVLFRQTIIVYLDVRRRRARLRRACSTRGGACGCARSASTRRPRTRSASRSTRRASGTSCSPARSPASAAPSSRSATASRSTRR